MNNDEPWENPDVSTGTFYLKAKQKGKLLVDVRSLMASKRWFVMDVCHGGDGDGLQIFHHLILAQHLLRANWLPLFSIIW